MLVVEVGVGGISSCGGLFTAEMVVAGLVSFVDLADATVNGFVLVDAFVVVVVVVDVVVEGVSFNGPVILGALVAPCCCCGCADEEPGLVDAIREVLGAEEDTDTNAGFDISLIGLVLGTPSFLVLRLDTLEEMMGTLVLSPCGCIDVGALVVLLFSVRLDEDSFFRGILGRVDAVPVVVGVVVDGLVGDVVVFGSVDCLVSDDLEDATVLVVVLVVVFVLALQLLVVLLFVGVAAVGDEDSVVVCFSPLFLKILVGPGCVVLLLVLLVLLLLLVVLMASCNCMQDLDLPNEPRLRLLLRLVCDGFVLSAGVVPLISLVFVVVLLLLVLGLVLRCLRTNTLVATRCLGLGEGFRNDDAAVVVAVVVVDDDGVAGDRGTMMSLVATNLRLVELDVWEEGV